MTAISPDRSRPKERTSVIHRILPALAFALTLSAAAAQATPQNPADAQAQEIATLQAARIGSVIVNPALDVIDACYGLGGLHRGFVDADRDGIVDTLVQYGAAMASAADYGRIGPRIIAPLRTQATLRAQAEIAQTMQVVVALDNGFVEDFVSNSDLGAQLATDVREQVSALASQRIRGATVTGTRFVSLDDGVCLVVRYEAPMMLNGMPTGRSAPVVAPPAPAGPPPPPAPGTPTPPGYQLPPPGRVGNF
jgi:hypothetical protein